MRSSFNAGRNVVQIIGFILIGVALLALYFGFIVWLGVRSGESERIERQLSTMEADIVVNYKLAQDSLEQDNYVLAERAIERVLTQVPYISDGEVSREDADLLYQQIIGRQSSVSLATPTVKLLPPPKASRAPKATATKQETRAEVTKEARKATPLPPTEPAVQVDEEELDDQIAAIEIILGNGEYETSIEELVAFQILNPNYARYETDSLLFNAYLGAGFQLTSGSEVARGVNYFELAQRLGTLPESASNQLDLSKTYLQGLAYRGVRWPVAISNFDRLCTLAANFHDACQLLYDSYLVYGRELEQSGGACAAVEQYQLAYTLTPNDTLNKTLSKAQYDCKQVASTPRPEGQGPWTPTPVPTKGAWTPTPESSNG